MTTSSMDAINATHDLALRSWVHSADLNTTDFPIQNLPFGRFRRAGTQEPLHIGVAIGDQALDLQAIGLVTTDDMNEMMAMSTAEHQTLRAAVSMTRNCMPLAWCHSITGQPATYRRENTSR